MKCSKISLEEVERIFQELDFTISPHSIKLKQKLATALDRAFNEGYEAANANPYGDTLVNRPFRDPLEKINGAGLQDDIPTARLSRHSKSL